MKINPKYIIEHCEKGQTKIEWRKILICHFALGYFCKCLSKKPHVLPIVTNALHLMHMTLYQHNLQSRIEHLIKLAQLDFIVYMSPYYRVIQIYSLPYFFLYGMYVNCDRQSNDFETCNFTNIFYLNSEKFLTFDISSFVQAFQKIQIIFFPFSNNVFQNSRLNEVSKQRKC